MKDDAGEPAHDVLDQHQVAPLVEQALHASRIHGWRSSLWRWWHTEMHVLLRWEKKGRTSRAPSTSDAADATAATSSPMGWLRRKLLRLLASHSVSMALSSMTLASVCAKASSTSAGVRVFTCASSPAHLGTGRQSGGGGWCHPCAAAGAAR